MQSPIRQFQWLLQARWMDKPPSSPAAGEPLQTLLGPLQAPAPVAGDPGRWDRGAAVPSPEDARPRPLTCPPAGRGLPGPGSPAPGASASAAGAPGTGSPPRRRLLPAPGPASAPMPVGAAAAARFPSLPFLPPEGTVHGTAPPERGSWSPALTAQREKGKQQQKVRFVLPAVERVALFLFHLQGIQSPSLRELKRALLLPWITITPK